MEPVSASTALLFGAGWFANKILGPSADALGNELRSFVSERTHRLVNSAEKKADPERATALPPPFFYNFAQKAAFSEDSNEINEMWSSLLADASESQNNRHSLFADILSRLSAEEAIFLRDFCGERSLTMAQQVVRSDIQRYLESDFYRNDGSVAQGSDEAHCLLEKVRANDFGWPVRFTNAQIPFREAGGHDGISALTTLKSGDDIGFAFELLVRERLIDLFDFSFSTAKQPVKFEGFLLTHIGAEFYRVCSRDDVI